MFAALEEQQMFSESLALFTERDNFTLIRSRRATSGHLLFCASRRKEQKFAAKESDN
jgi:hypothetical protein